VDILVPPREVGKVPEGPAISVLSETKHVLPSTSTEGKLPQAKRPVQQTLTSMFGANSSLKATRYAAASVRKGVLPNFISCGRLALPDFCGPFKGFKMASKTENVAKVSTCCLGDIKSQITPEKLPFYGKEQLLYYCKELRLKTTG